MAEPYISEIRIFGFNWAPVDWALCNGDEIQATQNPALYSLLGDQYGGTSGVSFKLPDLRGRVPINWSSNYPQGIAQGLEEVTLSPDELAAHLHTVKAVPQAGNTPLFTDGYFANAKDAFTSDPAAIYTTTPGPHSSQVSLNQSMVSSTGGGASHSNVQPSLVMSFCIALTGLYPARN